MIYLPPSQLKTTYLDSSDNALDIYCNYEKVALVGNFNAKIGTCLDNFLFPHELQSTNNEPIYFENAHNQNCIDFILTNRPGSFLSRQRLYLLDYQIFINWSCLYRTLFWMGFFETIHRWRRGQI